MSHDITPEPIVERAILAAALTNPQRFPLIADCPGLIVSDELATVFRAMRDEWNQRSRLDVLAVGLRFARAGGRASLVGELAAEAVQGFDFEFHAEQLRELAERRETAKELRARLAAVEDSRQRWGDVAEKIQSRLPTVRQQARTQWVSARDLVKQHPEQRAAVIGGLLRRGEVGTLVSGSKTGKSWLAYSLLLAVATGRPWLDTFPTLRGARALLLDNELAAESLAFRLARTAAACGVDLEQVGDAVGVVAFRGTACTLDAAERAIQQAPFKPDLVLVDSAYRCYPDPFDENSNAQVTAFFNRLTRIAESAQTAILLIHHLSKGEQSGKQLRDLGAGAGSWARAADLHVAMREHEEPDAVVFDGLVRSSAPITPFAMRFNRAELRWCRDDELDPASLKGGRKSPEARESERQARDETRKQATRDKQDQRVESVFSVHARTWLSPNAIKAHAGLSGAVVAESVVRLLSKKVLTSRLSAKRAGAVEYLLASSLEEVTEFENQTTGRDDSPPHPPDDCPVPSVATGGGIVEQDNPVCPVRPVQEGKRGKAKQRGSSGTRANRKSNPAPKPAPKPKRKPRAARAVAAAAPPWQETAVAEFTGGD